MAVRGGAPLPGGDKLGAVCDATSRWWQGNVDDFTHLRRRQGSVIDRENMFFEAAVVARRVGADDGAVTFDVAIGLRRTGVAAARIAETHAGAGALLRAAAQAGWRGVDGLLGRA